MGEQSRERCASESAGGEKECNLPYHCSFVQIESRGGIVARVSDEKLEDTIAVVCI